MSYPIIDEIYGQRLIWQGDLLACDDDRCRGLFEPHDQKLAYEVLRVEEGVPLFWQDHMTRLHHTVGDLFSVPDSLWAESCKLLSDQNVKRANLRIVLGQNLRVIHLSPSYYPSPALREKGVFTGILDWERPEPNAKLIRPDYKAAVARRFAQSGPYGDYFELLLRDRKDYFTEGSRSNLFFVDGKTVYSAPADRILLGITRKHVMSAIAAAGARFETRMFTLADLQTGQVEAAFLTGSPIDLLAIAAVEQVRLPSVRQPLLRQIEKAYQEIVAANIREQQRNMENQS